jgi:purine-binding chemotaxis protein CheW
MTTPPPNSNAALAKAGRYLTFTLGVEIYGLPVMNVREIIRLCPITPVPRMPDFIKGVINLRGTVIPVLDLRAKFQMSEAVYSERACIIVVQVRNPNGGSTLIGAIVDTVEEVVQFNESQLEPAPDFGGSPETQFILGLATVSGSVKTLLDPEKVFLAEGLLTLTSAQSHEPKTTNS